MKSLSFRLLLFNVLLLFLPMGSLLYLDVYEKQLLASQEASMIQQGRIMASALSAPDADRLGDEALRILHNLAERVDARIRVVDTDGKLLADSATIASAKETAINKQDSETEAASSAVTSTAPVPNTRFLYRIAVYPLNIIRKILYPPPNYSHAEFYSGSQTLLGPEIKAALSGNYGAITRYSSGGQVSITLYSAIPVFTGIGGEVIGAVLVSRSSRGILLNLYRLRMEIIKIFLMSLAVSLCLSLLLSLTITRPIKRLKAEAESVLDASGKFSGHFHGLRRRDEIGDLSRSLAALSAKLEKRSALIDTFISDLYHELKNPMTAIRGQLELSLASPHKEENLLAGIKTEEQRMERLLARLRELSRADSEAERDKREVIDLSDFIPLLAGRYTLTEGGQAITFTNLAAGAAFVKMNTDLLTQLLTNPIDNAVSFSPPGKKVTVSLEAEADENYWRITIDDEGPGIREESGSRYFNRFYTERSPEERSAHSGLGLAIVRAICEYEDSIPSLENRSECGCRFVLRLKRG